MDSSLLLGTFIYLINYTVLPHGAFKSLWLGLVIDHVVHHIVIDVVVHVVADLNLNFRV